jgi:hypothetical protein
MDRHTQLSAQRPAESSRWRRGAAMASALFAIAVAAILTAGVHWMTRADIRTAANRESALRALTVAEAGLAHALALLKGDLGDTTMTRLLRGWDGNKLTTDDNGVLAGYNLPTEAQIPAAGRVTPVGTYFVRLIDDQAEVDGDPFTDRNTRVLATCRGVTPDGASAQINAVVGNASMAGFSVNGNAILSGTVDLVGRCGGVHTNGSLTLSGPITAETRVSATGTVTGNATNTYGELLPKEQGAAPVEFPDLSAAAYCGRADYRISGSLVTNLLTGGIQTLPALGWSGSGGIYQPSASVTPGTYCIEGDVKISSTIGSAENPKPLSLILVNGSIEISGDPYLKAEDAEGILIMADGDLKLNGNATIGDEAFNGFIYAGAQCELSGTVTIGGQLICHNKANPPGAEAWVSENKMSGTAVVRYNCRGFLSQLWRVIAWYPVPGV